jgi:DNA polymerase I
MDLEFQLLDSDYVLINNTPVVRLFGKTRDNKTVCAFSEGHRPYFYVQPKMGLEQKLVEFLNENFKQLLVGIEEVEKILPIGYHKSRKKLLKIVWSDPSKIPSVRESLLKQSFVESIFEADILFKYRFMVDHDISGMRWYRVTGKPTATNTVDANRKLAITSIKEIPETDNADIRYMSIDIETVSKDENIPDPKKDPIVMVSISFSPDFNGKSTIVLVSKPVKRPNVLGFTTEKAMLEEFVKIINLFDPDVITGYNIKNFDFPFIFERLSQNRITRIIGRCKQKPASFKKFGIRNKVSIVGRIVVDVYELIKESIGKGLLRLKRYGLGDVSLELLGENKIEIVKSEIAKHWNGTEEKLTKLIEYAAKDSQLALKLLLERNMLDKFIELSKVSGLTLQDVLDSGETARAENLLLKEFNKEGFVLPLKPSQDEILKRKSQHETKGLKGALVLEPSAGLHTHPLIYLDFKAMYPSIFISYNICPTTLILDEENGDTVKTPYGAKFVSKSVRQGILPRILKILIDERDTIKSQIKKATSENEKRILDAKQLALKIMANAFYGYTGYVRARLYILDIANAITSCGRYLIQRTKDATEKDKSVKVVYGDTDSLIVETPTENLEEAFSIGKKIEQNINEELEGIVQVKIESLFKTLLILTKKRYAGLSVEKKNGEWEEKIMMKGIETVRRDWCELTSKTLMQVLDIILREQKPQKALNYVKEMLKKLEKNEIPIEDLVVTKGISKPLRTYKGMQPHIELVKKLRKRSPAEAPGIGDRVGFVIVQGSQLISERAEDPNYVKQHGLKIDSKYYIESQILPPLERVFDAMGIKKSDLFGLGKQLILTEAMRNNIKKREEALNEIDGVICAKCNQTYNRVPLLGKCDKCGGEILFYHGDIKSRYYSPM